MKKFISWLSLIVVGATVTYSVYGLLMEGRISFMPKRAALCLFLGIAYAVILVYMVFQRPNRLADN